MSDRNRLVDLEQRVADLSAQLDDVIRSGAIAGKNVRIGRTTDGGGTYPTDPANTFLVEILDGTYTRTPGNQTPTYTHRQATATIHAHNIANAFVPNGTVVEVFEWGTYWWFEYQDAS